MATRTTGIRAPAARIPVLLTAVLLAAVTACGHARPDPRPPAAAAVPLPARSAPSSPAIPSALISEARPIGAGRRFHPPAAGPVSGPCTPGLGPRDGVHVEVFAANRVLLLPAGIGTKPPRNLLDGRVTRAACYGQLVTLDPTGVVLVRPGARTTLGALFRSWGQPLSTTRLASFSAPAGTRVTVFVNGHRWPGPPAAVPLTRHVEIVLEVGPYVPPHQSYAFLPGT
jgi:hypothetical protein